MMFVLSLVSFVGGLFVHFRRDSSRAFLLAAVLGAAPFVFWTHASAVFPTTIAYAIGTVVHTDRLLPQVAAKAFLAMLVLNGMAVVLYDFRMSSYVIGGLDVFYPAGATPAIVASLLSPFAFGQGILIRRIANARKGGQGQGAP
jgi:hypothetical protein